MSRVRYFFLTFFLISFIDTAWAQRGWPREIETPEATITVYQPQPETFSGDKLTARTAISVTPKSREPVFGAIWVNARVATDRTARTVTLLTMNVTDVKFPQAVDSANVKKFKSLLETSFSL